MTISDAEKSRNIIDWITRSDRLFVVLFCILTGVILIAAYFMFKKLMKLLDDTKVDLEKEREGSRKEREEYFKTINGMQDILNDRLEGIDNSMREINTRVGFLIKKE